MVNVGNTYVMLATHNSYTLNGAWVGIPHGSSRRISLSLLSR